MELEETLDARKGKWVRETTKERKREFELGRNSVESRERERERERERGGGRSWREGVSNYTAV